MSNLPLVGVSACLLGQAVRYDGKDKYTALIAQELNKYCHLIAVCPEVEIGLGVPRGKIQLTQIGSSIKVLKMQEQTVDVSTELKNFAIQFVKKHTLSALVLQDKSPSCGIDNTKLYSQSGEQIGLGSGVFAATIMDLFPQIKVVQVSQLQNSEDIERFVQIIK
ncbi:MAG: DUF523 domain-containing protein [Methylococcales symbiont of Hymedesmia sp. n. MRB-2018]|nr:MAG: DUF523 domain-containing protein [Methylococcales symbiont of Hymedesmia sp. n. MRB-2018]KAF3983418.1 MAG: DUF523 domain-containing protein [Methylococcales symbiont of Hymedesmia sp. n. MRB-2018]